MVNNVIELRMPIVPSFDRNTAQSTEIYWTGHVFRKWGESWIAYKTQNRYGHLSSFRGTWRWNGCGIYKTDFCDGDLHGFHDQKKGASSRHDFSPWVSNSSGSHLWKRWCLLMLIKVIRRTKKVKNSNDRYNKKKNVNIIKEQLKHICQVKIEKSWTLIPTIPKRGYRNRPYIRIAKTLQLRRVV